VEGAGFALLTVLTTAAWTLVLRLVMETWPVGLAGTVSRIVTLAALGGWVLSTGRGWRRLRLDGLHAQIALMGVISIAINLLLFASLKWTTATNQALLFRLDLVFAVLIGGLLGLEHIGPGQLMLLPVMLAGMALVTGISQFDWHGRLVGDLMVTVSAACFAANAFVIRNILRRMDEEAVALYNHGISMLGFVGLALVAGELSVARDSLQRSGAWLWVVVLGSISAVSLPLYYAALRRMAIWKLRAWMLTTPVAVAAVEWPLWGNRLSLTQCLGAAMVLGGLAVLIRVESRTMARWDEESPAAS